MENEFKILLLIVGISFLVTHLVALARDIYVSRKNIKELISRLNKYKISDVDERKNDLEFIWSLSDIYVDDHEKDREHKVKIIWHSIHTNNSLLTTILMYLNFGLVNTILDLSNTYGSKEIEEKKKTIVGMILGNKIKTSSLNYLILIGAFAIYLILSIFALYEINGICVFLISIAIFFIYVDQKLMIYRINNGWYGKNEFEAREIINFIINHSDTDDFIDGDGLKKIIPDAQMEEFKNDYPKSAEWDVVR